ncbi:2-phospho-L-lactate transferase CofD family protein, partial [Megamonas hypermegale]|uniref:2-phospho-L-lactate transferase CofD family protein n=1 Tax=Megamonas hypermegale TaxID=158847 RepID=UPI00242DB556
MHLLKWLYPGLKFKRWLFLFAIGVLLTGMGLAVVFNYKYLDSFEELVFYVTYTWTGTYNYTVTALVGSIVILLGVAIMLLATRMIIRSLITVLVPDKSSRLVDMIYEHRRLDKGPNITVVGGGTGLSVLLRGMKEATRNVTAVVTVADDGGSSGRLREEF